MSSDISISQATLQAAEYFCAAVVLNRWSRCASQERAGRNICL